MLLQNRKVAIVGGGPGGLILARLLQAEGADLRVYERDLNKQARVQGSPLDLHEESGLAAITKAGLLNEFRANYLQGADRMLIVNELAEILYSDHATKGKENFGSAYFRPEIDRAALRKILLDSLLPETIRWDRQFVSMENSGDGWILYFKNGTSEYADLVVAADGANSKIRPYITDIKAFYSGIMMLEGNVYNAEKSVSKMYDLLGGGKIMAFGNKKNILLGQKANKEIGFYASFKADEDWPGTCGLDFSDKLQILHWFKNEYFELSNIWNELFKNAAIPFIPRPIYCMPLEQSWKSIGNLTLLGDAAHVMPPFAVEGVNMAMLDAMELSEQLTSREHNSLEAAISCFEISMCKRAAIAAKESLENGERMHAEMALTEMLNFFNGHQLGITNKL